MILCSRRRVLSMSDYALGKDIADILSHLKSLEKQLEILSEDVSPTALDETKSTSSAERLDTVSEVQVITFNMADLHAGPGYVENAVIEIYSNGLWRTTGRIGNASRHSTSELIYWFQIRNADGTAILLELLVIDEFFGPGGYSDSPRPGNSSTLATYFQGLKTGQNTVWHRLKRIKKS